MKESEVRQGLKAAFGGVRRLIHQKYVEKRGKQKGLGQGEPGKESGAPGHAQPSKAPSFFDLVYNYFTESATEEDNQEKLNKEEASEIQAWSEIKARVLSEENQPQIGGDYDESLDERLAERLGEKWSLQKSRLPELISLLCAQARDNYNQEEGTLCLAFLDHIIHKQTDHGVETLEKLW